MVTHWKYLKDVEYIALKDCKKDVTSHLRFCNTFDAARIAYGPHTGILSIARARSELKQLSCCINPDFSVKMSNISNFITRKKKKKRKKKGKKEKRGGHIIKCLLTELGRAGQENIWPSVMAHGPRCARFRTP